MSDTDLEQLEENARAYNKLIDRVEEIDPEAAKYLRNGVFELKSFSPDGTLDESFVWEDSLQGHTYWMELDEKLNPPEAA